MSKNSSTSPICRLKNTNGCIFFPIRPEENEKLRESGRRVGPKIITASTNPRISPRSKVTARLQVRGIFRTQKLHVGWTFFPGAGRNFQLDNRADNRRLKSRVFIRQKKKGEKRPLQGTNLLDCSAHGQSDPPKFRFLVDSSSSFLGLFPKFFP